jgi:hypothetical protein
MASKDPNFYRLRNANFYRIDPPQYVAFRKADGHSTLAVIARLEPATCSGISSGAGSARLHPMEIFATCRLTRSVTGSMGASHRS